jgi:hypothetical protein
MAFYSSGDSPTSKTTKYPPRGENTYTASFTLKTYPRKLLTLPKKDPKQKFKLKKYPKH